MGQKIQMVKGFRDVLPPESALWQWAEQTAREVFESWGFQEVRLPLVEHTELFARSIGQGTDIVEKEMYTFPDRKGRSLSLRPEGTASVARAYLASGLEHGSLTKWYYSGPMFRYERPQKGRYRQFWQMGVEVLGDPGPALDAELLAMLQVLFSRLGIGGLSLEINSLGCPVCRPVYKDKLLLYLETVKQDLCPECQKRLYTNPLRILDCKVPSCKSQIEEAPSTMDSLCPACLEHLAGLKRRLGDLEVVFQLNPHIVRGLDYYTRTAFELLAQDGLGAQNAVAAGGRYDTLLEELGGPPTPAFGFALGMDRLLLLVPEEKRPRPGVDLCIAALGEKAYEAMFPRLHKVRQAGIKAEMIGDEQARGLKAKLRRADKLHARYALIVGEEELDSGQAVLRNMASGEQQRLSLQRLVEELAERIACSDAHR